MGPPKACFRLAIRDEFILKCKKYFDSQNAWGLVGGGGGDAGRG